MRLGAYNYKYKLLKFNKIKEETNKNPKLKLYLIRNLNVTNGAAFTDGP